MKNQYLVIITHWYLFPLGQLRRTPSLQPYDASELKLMLNKLAKYFTETNILHVEISGLPFSSLIGHLKV